jgi:hypothetical protein
MLVTVPHATGISYKFTRAVNLPFLPNAHVREISLLERGFEARDFCFELPASPINKCFYGVDNRLSEFFAIETHGSPPRLQRPIAKAACDPGGSGGKMSSHSVPTPAVKGPTAMRMRFDIGRPVLTSLAKSS